jgi:putative hydrolase of the HAD superfamily
MVINNWNDIDLSHIKGLLVDLDDTLYHYEPVHKVAFEACINYAEQHYGIQRDSFKELWKIARDKVHTDVHGQGASHSRLLYLQKVHELYSGKTNAEFALKLENEYWTVFLNAMSLRKGVEAFLQKAKGAGIKMAIVTDLTAQIQLQKWQKLQLDRYFDFLISSEEAGIEKPSPYIFELALDKLQLKVNEVIMIGDNEKKDIAGANALQIKAYQVNELTE